MEKYAARASALVAISSTKACMFAAEEEEEKEAIHSISTLYSVDGENPGHDLHFRLYILARRLFDTEDFEMVD